MDLARYGGIFLAMAVLFSGLGRQEEENKPNRTQRRTAPMGGYVTADGTYLLPVMETSPTVREIFPRAANRRGRKMPVEGIYQ